VRLVDVDDDDTSLTRLRHVHKLIADHHRVAPLAPAPAPAHAPAQRRHVTGSELEAGGAARGQVELGGDVTADKTVLRVVDVVAGRVEHDERLVLVRRRRCETCNRY